MPQLSDMLKSGHIDGAVVVVVGVLVQQKLDALVAIAWLG